MRMDDETREIYDFLWREVAFVKGQSIILEQMFSENESIDVLNKTARTAFKIIFESLRDSTIMGVSRLTDDHRHTRDNQNYYTLKNLANRLCNDDITKTIEETESVFCPIRALRDQQKAHSDKAAQTLTPVFKREIEAAVLALINIMRVVERVLGEPAMPYGRMMMPGDGAGLLEVLKHEVDARNHRLEGANCWYYPSEDLISAQYDQTGLRLDPTKKLDRSMSRPEVLNKAWELLGAVSEHFENKPKS